MVNSFIQNQNILIIQTEILIYLKVLYHDEIIKNYVLNIRNTVDI